MGLTSVSSNSPVFDRVGAFVAFVEVATRMTDAAAAAAEDDVTLAFRLTKDKHSHSHLPVAPKSTGCMSSSGQCDQLSACNLAGDVMNMRSHVSSPLHNGLSDVIFGACPACAGHVAT